MTTHPDEPLDQGRPQPAPTAPLPQPEGSAPAAGEADRHAQQAVTTPVPGLTPTTPGVPQPDATPTEVVRPDATRPLPAFGQPDAGQPAATQPWSAPAAETQPVGVGAAPYAPAQPAQAPYGYAAAPAPAAAGPVGAGGGLPPQLPPDGATPAAGASGPRERNGSRLWMPVVGVGVVAALLASLGTAALVTGSDDDSTRPSSISSIGQSSSDSVPVSGSTSSNPDWEKVAQAVQAAVVAIQVTTSSGTAEGSGVIIDDSGHILTNNHVVSGAQDDKVQVNLTDGRVFTADVVGTDPTTDLAVIKLEDAPDDLTVAALGDSASAAVGQGVMAVGNPLGLANTATTGIISAVDRPVSTSESGSETVVTNAIQIDAAINPGNSGGPLFDAEGRVIAITSSIATTSSESGSIGLGFAIPINLAKMVASQLIEDGVAEHAFLGVGLVDGNATADGVTRQGAQVQTVSDGSPAAAAGLQEGDTIVAIDGKAVGGREALTGYVRGHASGDEVTLTLVRDGESLDVDVTLATREETSTSSGQSEQGQDQQGQGEQGQQGQDGGSQQAPDGLDQMTPEQLWEWFQQQEGANGQG